MLIKPSHILIIFMKHIWLTNISFSLYVSLPTLVVCNGSFLTRCAGFAPDLRRSCAGFASELCRICSGFASDLCRIWRGILTLALTLTPTSSIPRQSDEVVWKPNLYRATKLRVSFSPKATKSR